MFKPTYHERNLANLEKLAPNTKRAAMEWYNWCVANSIDILIYETLRTKENNDITLPVGSHRRCALTTWLDKH